MFTMITTLMIILAIFSIAATCYFGAKALKSRRRTRLAFFEESCISLFQSIVESIEGLEVTYQKEKIGPSLVLLKACVVNTGDMDIDRSSVHKPLRLSLPQSFKWLKAKILSSSPEVNATWELPNPNDLVFRWDLLKPNEYFRFDALAETSATPSKEKKEIQPAKALKDRIRFSHRIANLHILERGRLHELPRRRVSAWIPPLVTLVLGMVGIVLIFGPLTPRKLVYELELNHGDKVRVSIKPKGHDQLRLKQIDGPFRDLIKASDFFDKYSATPTVVRSSSAFYFLLSIFVFYVIVGGGSLVFFVRRLRRQKKRLRMVRLLK